MTHQIDSDFDPDDVTLCDLHEALQSLSQMVAELRDRLAGAWKSHLSVEEVAVEVKRAPYTVRQWIREGRLRAERVAGCGPRGRLLIPQEELQRLIATGRGAKIPAAVCPPDQE